MQAAVLLQRCVHCIDAALLVAVLLHRWRTLLSCCSASSSGTVPMASIAIMLLCYM
ncbi:hypothetical protein PF005_g2028 [Phytophthora fragariae]|uniref:Uncharacterized protein n=1 Tax=Phytophthora fragariae TaxID=53985 RepID=A0A6A3FQD1_9STRA|nr:hypothetical protein PF003_g1228 [Phytophthora fragariae]KAE8948315.1 hypothetical protein PF009_g2120 [Phytophthora fragariae]KAE9003425.1 hypothetical protein PF011_g12903 [Phytophthora fragariae]KAE9136453.1 hypothetical protein PF010_g1696 [Phytophthora fragariae]KAE9137538.1 hypothetical protein PF007_g1772 [Phytophthora fragariae]